MFVPPVRSNVWLLILIKQWPYRATGRLSGSCHCSTSDMYSILSNMEGYTDEESEKKKGN